MQQAAGGAPVVSPHPLSLLNKTYGVYYSLNSAVWETCVRYEVQWMSNHSSSSSSQQEERPEKGGIYVI